MPKGIVKDLDKGFYDAAREKGLHPLTYLTDLVRPDPPEVEKLAQRLKRRYPGDVLDGNFGRHVDDLAYKLAGLQLELNARGIRPDDTVEKAFFSSANGPNQPLFPVWLASNVIAGQLAGSLVPHLVASEVQIESHVQEKITIADTAETRQLKFIGEGAELPKTTIAKTDGNITLYKYGRMLEATYEAVRLMHLDILGLQLRRMGLQIGIDQSDDLIETLIAGDGNASTAITDTDAEVSGTLDYDELTRLYLAFDIGYKMRHAVINSTHLRTILNMAEFKDPTAGFQFVNEGVLPGPLGAVWHRWDSTGSASFSTDRILAVDSMGAAVIYREGDLLEESDALIDKQMHRRTISEWVGVMKWDNQASQCLDIVT